MRYGLVFWSVAVSLLAVRADAADYLRDIKPLLLEKCVSCHGPLREEAGLRLDTAASLREGGDAGPVVVAHQPEASYLIERVAAESAVERMPPEGEGEPLTAAQLAELRDWIESGMPAPEDEQPLSAPDEHWAYQPVRRPPVPAGEAAHPIDRFLAATQRQSGVQPAARADAATRLRRVTFDLIGLPPTRADVARLVADDSPQAYRRAVDRLLEDPRYGERWGRHWMDVWRYSDWDGYKQELRGSQRHIWRWRDWIIESLNDDKPYDRMVMEMIAGDELAPTDPDTLRATGFLARNYHNSNRDIWLDATVEHTAKAFLAMTIACARCHDHKYDPIPQTDYYAFRAIFEPHRVRTDRVPGEADRMRDGLPRAYDAEPDAATYLYIAGNEKLPDEDNPLDPAVPAFLARAFEVRPVPLPAQAHVPALAPHVEREDRAAAEKRVRAARETLRQQQAAVEEEQQQQQTAGHDDRDAATASPDARPSELVIAERTLEAAEAQRRALAARWAAERAKYGGESDPDRRAALAAEAVAAERRLAVAEAELGVATQRRAVGEARAADEDEGKGAAIEQAEKQLTAAREQLAKAEAAAAEDPNDGNYTPVGEVYPPTTTGRRLALARWIADAQNPLTARVAVNHLWLRHFGAPLVENVFDFGLLTPEPEHRALLDWLAAEFVESGWSMKHLHRLMVTSEAYQADSRVGGSPRLAESAAADPDNALFWRARVRRLDAEVIRDSLFALTGGLDSTLGGPEIPATEGEAVPRRSLYFQHAYEKQMTMLTLFDAASPNECYRRKESIIPQQALVLANSGLSLSQARRLAGQLGAEVDSNDAFIAVAFEHILARPPSDRERKACAEFLDRQRRLLERGGALTASAGKASAAVAPSRDPAARARENLVHVLMNHNDFVTVR